MTTIYCTYFDHRYLAKGLAMIYSLRRCAGNAHVYVLCLDQKVGDMLLELAEPGVHPIALSDFEAGDTDLAAAKADGRSTVEYYFTLTASLVLYVMGLAPDAGIVTYLDSDLWFLADPEPIYQQMGSASVLIIPHGFAPKMKHLEKFGLYNVGWVSFRANEEGRACAQWWRERTIEWCFDRLEDGRYADQGYLDQFPEMFQCVHVLAHRGANLAPWNVAASTISVHDGIVWANDDRVLFFHFHGLRRLPDGGYLASHGYYKAPLTAVVRDALYKPYLRELMAIEGALAKRFGAFESSTIRAGMKLKRGAVAALKQALRMAINRLRGYVIVPD